MNRIDLGSIALTQGAHLLLKRALRSVPVGERLGVSASSPDMLIDLRSWCRSQGHTCLEADAETGLLAWVIRGTATEHRWQHLEQAGRPDVREPGAIEPSPAANWGFAARGALVESGGMSFHYALATREQVWAHNLPRLYAQAIRSQWNPHVALDWNVAFELAPDVEGAVVQVMTYLIENENAALQVPARFIAQVHPHFREVLQLLALQVADEARHVEVFTRRATLRGESLGLSTVSGQQSLRTLLDEPDFALASFMLSVMGEGTFLNLLRFLELHAPESLTRDIARLVFQDEARHVAFGVGHLQYQIQADPSLRDRLAAAVVARHDALAQTSGLNEEVYDALVLIAAGSWEPGDIAQGFSRVQALTQQMHAGRKARLERLGFTASEADELAALHTRNFM